MWHCSENDGWHVQFCWQHQTASSCIYAFHAYRYQVAIFIFLILMGLDWVLEEIKMSFTPKLIAVPSKEDSSQQLSFLSFHRRVLSVSATCGC
jgi:nicotinic acid phosphoribosyltransferase